jgi:hypothetical protein
VDFSERRAQEITLLQDILGSRLHVQDNHVDILLSVPITATLTAIFPPTCNYPLQPPLFLLRAPLIPIAVRVRVLAAVQALASAYCPDDTLYNACCTAEAMLTETEGPALGERSVPASIAPPTAPPTGPASMVPDGQGVVTGSAATVPPVSSSSGKSTAASKSEKGTFTFVFFGTIACLIGTLFLCHHHFAVYSQ